jgi:hypothetical protein
MLNRIYQLSRSHVHSFYYQCCRFFQNSHTLLNRPLFFLKFCRSDKANNNGKRRGGGFTKLCSLSPILQEFVGASELARTEVTQSPQYCRSILYIGWSWKGYIPLSYFLLFFVAFRLSRSFGRISEKIICRTKVIRGRFYVMTDWRSSSMSIPLICSKWIKHWPNISGHWILMVSLSLYTHTLKCHLNCRKKTMGTNLNINIEYEFSHLRVNVMKSVKVITAEASLPFASTVPYSVLGLGCQHTLQPSWNLSVYTCTCNSYTCTPWLLLDFTSMSICTESISLHWKLS